MMLVLSEQPFRCRNPKGHGFRGLLFCVMTSREDMGISVFLGLMVSLQLSDRRKAW